MLIVDGDVASDISLLENRKRFIAVMQSGIIKAGQLANRAMDADGVPHKTERQEVTV